MAPSYRNTLAFAAGVFSLYNTFVSIVRECVRDLPSAFYLLDGNSPYTDYSGYSTSAIASGTPDTSIGLVSGAMASKVFSSSATTTVPSNIFKQGKENDSFTLEAWVRQVGSSSSEQQIVGNSGNLDGLTINGTLISFVTKYLTASESRVSFDIQEPQVVYAVGVHTSEKNSLYINGVLVGEATINDVQRQDKFMTTTGLSSGGTSGAQSIAVNAIATYPKALSADRILLHYNVGIDVPDIEDIVPTYGGLSIPVSLNNADVFLNQTWSTDLDWNSGIARNISIVNGTLIPQFSGDTSVPGQWLTSVAISSAPQSSLYGATMNWDGIGATIECSVDGVTWETVQRGENLASIPNGFDPTDKVLQVRVSFLGGVLSDTSYLDNLNITILNTNTPPSIHGRTVSLTNVYQEREYPPLALHENWGAQIDSGGSISISSDTSDQAAPIRTIEIWAKPEVDYSGTPGGAAAATYQNGVASGATLKAGKWVVYHRVLSSDLTGTLNVNIQGQIGQIVLYPTALTSQQVNAIYAQYTRTLVTKIVDGSTISFIESATPVKIYAYDWTVMSVS